MNISKTLFKTLSRCPNAPALYNMYINRAAHDVKEINGIDLNDIKNEIDKLDSDIFSELSEYESEIFGNMYDEDTGEDLTIVTSAQLEAFKDIFVEVEERASKYIETLFNKKVVASKNTYEQKRFEYSYNGNKYYCYLDIYIEEENKLKIFEVKSTTSSKIDELHVTFKRGNPLPLFKMNNETKIMEFIGNNYIEELNVDKDTLLSKMNNVLDRYSDVGKYLYDISIERHIIEQSFLTVGEEIPEIEYYLVTLNHNYRYDGLIKDGKRVYNTSKDNEELFKIYDVNYLSKEYQNLILEERAKFDKESEYLKIRNNCLGTHCKYKKNDQCKFFNICHKPVLTEGSILEFTGRHYCFKSLTELTKTKKPKTLNIYELINDGIYTMEDALIYTPDIDQHIEYDCYKNNKQYIDKENLKFLIDKISYPLYHLDFESYNCPLPRFIGEKPYAQSLFQYSLHIEKEPGCCEIDNENGLYHLEYLAPDHEDHRRDIAERLIKDIDLSNGGSVLAYHAVFEKTRISELMSFYPDLKDQLQVIYDAIFDLEDVLHASEKLYQKYDPTYSLEGKPKFNFYDKNLHASFSIKKVLPIFTDLSYSNMDVKNGTEAILTYGMLAELTDKEYEEKYLALRKYCRLDTWSMVKILQGLKNLI